MSFWFILLVPNKSVFAHIVFHEKGTYVTEAVKFSVLTTRIFILKIGKIKYTCLIYLH